MSSESESFLIRWSRRKLAAERETERQSESAAPAAPAAPPTTSVGDQRAGTEPVPAPALASGTAATTEVPLPPIESLDGLRSDYQAFFQQPVDEGLRRAALTKLFADPHFNQMDMLDVYVDDYTQFEPLSDAMRLRLPSARDFLLDSERAALEAAEARSGATSELRRRRRDRRIDFRAGTGAERSARRSTVDGTSGRPRGPLLIPSKPA
jgi:hypothetical protein